MKHMVRTSSCPGYAVVLHRLTRYPRSSCLFLPLLILALVLELHITTPGINQQRPLSTGITDAEEDRVSSLHGLLKPSYQPSLYTIAFE